MQNESRPGAGDQMTAVRWLRQRIVLWRWLPLLAWMGLIFYLSAQSNLFHPKVAWADLLLSSAAHLALFAVLAVLWVRALGPERRFHLAAWLFSMLYALSDEMHQAFVPGRQPDVWDLAADGLGAWLGLWAWRCWRRRDR